MIPFGRYFAAGRHKRVVQVAFAQGGKTETSLDCIGERFDNRPAPGLYVGPSKEFLTDQFEPRLMAMLDEAPKLAAKVSRGKRNKKTLKFIAGSRLRLAHAGSSTALKSDPVQWALVDEYDEMLANIKGQGDPLGLVEARGDTYPDFVVGLTSTCSRGSVLTRLDEAMGLEFWRVAEAADVESGIWRKWQEGTMHHMVWPCPHCRKYFVPRFRNLKWPAKASPAEAKRSAWLECPNCHKHIEEIHKREMNNNFAYASPFGHWIFADGSEAGTMPDTSTISFWCSGLASPFKSFGDRAETFLIAVRSGNPNEIQTALNAGFGELYVPGGGEAPKYVEIIALKEEEHELGIVPPWVAFLTASVDVQKDRLYFLVRGWGPRATSLLIHYGVLYAEGTDVGNTTSREVWDQLAAVITQPIDGMPIRLCFVDSGFRPGKPWQVPENRVYEFCRRFPKLTRPTKGHDTQRLPVAIRKQEITGKGKIAAYGLDLAHLDTDYWKSWIFERIRWAPDKPGAWKLPRDVSNDYCTQIVSETREVLPSGRVHWRQKQQDNHYLDLEAMAAAAGWLLNAHHIPDGYARRGPDARPATSPERPTTRAPRQVIRSSYMS